ncbi:MAG: PEGA domain-containing protein, partial [Rubrivivax sp.]|nr:PEGA domain-containing protein [Rubrivivax sp.]
EPPPASPAVAPTAPGAEAALPSEPQTVLPAAAGAVLADTATAPSIADLPAAAAPASAPLLTPAPAPDPKVARSAAASPAARASPAPQPQPAQRRDNSAAAAAAGATPAKGTGSVKLAISPWGQVEVNGRQVGIAPPLTRLSLPEGQHTVTVRNDDFPPFTTTVQVQADKATTVRHRFTP